MPNFDGGHYFYTGLFPVRLDSVQRPDGSYTVHSHLLREALASLPNFSEASGSIRTSPFARCRSTHFVRLAVIDEPEYNGRDPVDALRQAAKGIDLLAHQPVDHFSRAWLMFAADFDAVDAGARDRWAAGLWDLMQPELVAIFEHCCDFTSRDQLKFSQASALDPVKSGADFAAYLARGQIETTMSFNIYGLGGPPLKDVSIGALLGLALIPALLVGFGGAWLRWGPFHRPWHWWPWQWGWAWPWHWDWCGILLVILAALVGLFLGAWLIYKIVMRRGARPFPTAPDSDLKSVLKGLFLQQRLVDFAIAHQEDEPDELYSAFGQFIGKVQPDDVESPTQARGVLKA